ncbi:unnamed protein product [Urochloa humidicola]
MYDCDQHVNESRNTLRSCAWYIKSISRLDTRDWDLMKIATALMIICCPEENIEDPRWLFSKEELERLRKDAPRYTMMLKEATLSLYDEVSSTCKLRTMAGRGLIRLGLVPWDKKTYETETSM